MNKQGYAIKELLILFAVLGIEKGKKYFRMIGSGNIYDESGEIAMHNVSAK